MQLIPNFTDPTYYHYWTESQRVTGVDEQPRSFQSLWIFLIGVIFPLITSWILNIVFILSIVRHHHKRNITNLYAATTAGAAMLAALVNFPSKAIFDVTGIPENAEHICTVWIFLETVTCHVIQLQLLGSSLDTYLRLVMPRWHVISGGQPLKVCLKLAAPWLVAILQTAAQICLGDPLPPAILEGGRVCLCADVNFLILRASVAFFLPLTVSIVILFLAAHRLKANVMVSGSKTFPSDQPSHWIEHITSKPGSKPSENRMRQCGSGCWKWCLCSTETAPINPETSYSVDSNHNASNYTYSKRTSCCNQTYEQVDENTTILPALLPECNTQDFPGSLAGDELKLSTLELHAHPRTWGAPPILPTSSALANSVNETAYSNMKNTNPTVNHFCPQHGHVLVSLSPITYSRPEVYLVQGGIPTTSNTLNSDKDDCKDKEGKQIRMSRRESKGTSSSLSEHSDLITENNMVLTRSRLHKDSHGSIVLDVSENGIEDLKSSSFGCSTNDVNGNELAMVNLEQGNFERNSIKLNMVTCALSITLWAPLITASLAYLLLSNTTYAHLLPLTTLIQFKWLSYATAFAYTIGYLIVDPNLRKGIL